MIDVTAAIISRQNQLLITQRPSTDQLAGLWEFPGGKVEYGETPEACLEREIKEELNIEVRVGEFFMESIFNYPDKKIRLLAYWSEWVSGDLVLQVHDQWQWVTCSELNHFQFAPADVPIVKKLQQNCPQA